VWDGTAWQVVSGGSSITVSDTAPTGASEGDGWFKSDTGSLFVYYGTAWVEVGGGGGGASVTVSDTAPATAAEGDLWFKSDTGVLAVYYGTAWVEIGGGGSGGPEHVIAELAPTAADTKPDGTIWFAWGA
jgi:hypothetical protein